MNLKKRGFTIIELIVSVGIISIIMGTVLFNGSKLSSNLSLTGASQDISLIIRQAQSYGISVKESSLGSSSFDYGYGIFFDITYPTNAFIYVDKNSNGLYDGDANCSVGGECVEKISIKDGISINQLCVYNSGLLQCSGIKSVSINFIRPNPEPFIKALNYSNSEVYFGSSDARIVLQNNQGAMKTVGADILGKITVQ